MRLTLAFLLSLCLSTFADTMIRRDDLFRLGYTAPEVSQNHLDDLSLDAGQREKLTKLLDDSHATMPGLQAAAKEQGQALETLVSAPNANPDEANKGLHRLLEAEGALKRLQLRTILGINAILTPDQRTRALQLAKKDVELEASTRALAERFRTTLDSLGVKPTPAMLERGEQIKPLLEAGKFAAARDALDTAAKDFGLDDTATLETLDFSKFQPGNTDLSLLQQRFAEVEQRVQRVVNIPLLRQLIQAHAELESAKSGQDAIAFGRILTWAEGVLPNAQ